MVTVNGTNGQTVSQSEEPLWPSTNARGYSIPNQPSGTLHHRKVICVGAGISGICLAHEVSTQGENLDLVIYDVASGYGGTWFWNTYPGCRCDVPAHNYQLPWAANPDWTEFYATAPEIQRYYAKVVEDHDLAKYINLEHEVIKAEWQDDRSKWVVTVRGPDGREFTDEGDIFINASGILNSYKWPKIPTLKKFKGALVHTARWPQDLEWKGKKIAVLGSGSSGIQILASMQPEADHIFHWIRSPTWITSAFAQQFAGPNGTNFAYTEEQRKRFREDPQHALKYRKMMESELNQRFKFIVQGTPEQKASLEYANKDMRQRLKYNQRLIDAIVPTTFNVGCRRPTPGMGYLEALLEPNVTTYTEMFKEITEEGFVQPDGTEEKVDIFICATGFDTTFRPKFPIIGSNGINLQDKWKDYPVDAYMAVTVADMPNYFIYYGPYGPNGHGSGAPMIDVISRSFMKIIQKIQRENITSMQIKKKATEDFVEHAKLYLKRTAWAQTCSSWFKPPGQEAADPIMHPGNRILFIEQMENPRWEDYDYTYGYANNRFGCWGNGFTIREEDGRDTTWYYGLLENTDTQPDYSDIRPMYSQMMA
ncbi:FAD/NAD-P-binding domain-containing protein [Cystobasidium minutum MCA 4210]|uniref:FAD/NAD-P-binding domain-containing protein n=1 Tax=Cystobasidium minutum MCA 4210 TaxID=1397322 RepID=UPI0034CD6435|eukprot:jgi/Rhomi1/41722/CE41721_222